MVELAEIGLAPIAALFGVAHGLFYPAYSALAAEETPPEDRGKLLALLQAWFNAGVAGSCYGLGMLAEARGYPLIFAVAAACVFAAIFPLLASSMGLAGRRGPRRQARRRWSGSAKSC